MSKDWRFGQKSQAPPSLGNQSLLRPVPGFGRRQSLPFRRRSGSRYLSGASPQPLFKLLLLPSTARLLIVTAVAGLCTRICAAMGCPLARLVVFGTKPPNGITSTGLSVVPDLTPVKVRFLLTTTCSG